MPMRCRLCRKPTVEGSIFCNDHRQQAQMFSATFVAPTPEAMTSLASPLPAPGSQPAHPAPALGAAPPTTEAAQPLEDLGETTLLQRVSEALRVIRARAEEAPEKAAKRWPQVAIYCLHDRLLCRPFYSIVPAARAGGGGGYALAADVISEAMGHGGNVFHELRRLYLGRREQLRLRQLQTLDLHFLTYAGLIAINERTPGQSETNVLTFSKGEKGFEPVEAATVKERLGHERW